MGKCTWRKLKREERTKQKHDDKINILDAERYGVVDEGIGEVGEVNSGAALNLSAVF